MAIFGAWAALPVLIGVPLGRAVDGLLGELDDVDLGSGDRRRPDVT